MRNILFIFGVVCVKMAVTQLSACPESCFCMDSFVTCSDFKFLDLTLLPPNTDTLVLTKGDVEEIPPGFLATATKLKMLELMAVNVRIVRGSAFRGLRHMDLLSITSCAFDIVEPDGFSGLTEVGKIHISDSTFGRLGKHAFAYINNVPDFKIWSSNFETIADEAFYKLSDVFSFQFYHNNITTMGSNVFLGAVRLDDVAITMNRIHAVSKGSFESIAEGADRMMLNANTFVCSCDLAWLLEIQILEEYLGYNFCSFPGKLKAGASTYILSEISRDALCSPVPSTPALESTTFSSQDVAHSEHSDDINIMEEVWDYDIHAAEEVHTDMMLSKLSNDSASTPSTATTIPSVSSESSSAASHSSSSSLPLSSSSFLPSSSFLALLLSTSPPPPPLQPSSTFSQPSSTFSQPSSTFSQPSSSSPSPFSLTSLLNSSLITASSQASTSSTPATTQPVNPLLSFSSDGDISPSVSSNNEIPPSPVSNRDIPSSALSNSEILSSFSSDKDASSHVSSSNKISSSTSSNNELSSSVSSNNELSSSVSSNNELSSSVSSNNEISSSDLLNGDISSPASSNKELSSSVSSNGVVSSSVSFNDKISSAPLSNIETSSSVSSNNASSSSHTTEDAKLVLTNQSSSFSQSAILSESDSFLLVNSEPAGEESIIVTSQSSPSVSTLYQSTEWPRDEEIVDKTERAINIYDSQQVDDDKLVHKQEDRKETQQEINVPIITDNFDTADLGAQTTSTPPTNTNPVVTNKHEHAIAYTEAAFAMADPSSHNDAQSSRCACFIMLLLGIFVVLIGNYCS